MNTIVKRTEVRRPEGERRCRKKSKSGSNLFFFVFFLFVIVLKIVPILRLFLFFLFVLVIGDGIDLDGMNLHDFHFGFALEAGQDFAFLDFVFVKVNFSCAFRTPDHGGNLLGDRVRARLRRKARENQDTLAAEVLYNAKRSHREAAKTTMTPRREYPDQPMIGVGGVVIDNGRTLLIRRASPPLKGEWSIPGGLLEVGETLEQGVARELAEETGLDVRVVELIEVFERIFPAPANADGTPGDARRPQYHFVILDYLCEIRGGTLSAGSDALEFAWAREEELANFGLTVAVTRVLKRAFARTRERASSGEQLL
jgi:8-oxo-dGTP diphosphatase